MSVELQSGEPQLSTPLHHRWVPSFARFRIGLVGIMLISPFLIRAWFLSKIPDIPVPFDVEAYCREVIPPGQNAFDHYRKAFRLKQAVDQNRVADNNEALWANLDEVLKSGWSAANEPLKKWLDDYEATLAEWHRGTECSGALYLNIREMDFYTQVPVSHSMREIARIAQCDAARLEGEGNFLAAGETWIAILRSSRHSGRSGVAIERLTGRALHRWATEGLNDWAANSKLTKEELNSVLGQVREADQMSLPLSSLFKSEYLVATNSLKRANWNQMTQLRSADSDFVASGKRLLLWVVGEPLAMQRLFRQILANQLNEIDKPLPQQQPYAGTGTAMLFQPYSSIAMPRNHLTPAEIDRAIQRSLVAKEWIQSLKFIELQIARERAQQITIELALALRAYQRDQGEFPVELSSIFRTDTEVWPVDPCDKLGGLIRYRRDGANDAVIWSVGLDGNDDGGKVEDAGGHPADVGFVVRVP